MFFGAIKVLLNRTGWGCATHIAREPGTAAGSQADAGRWGCQTQKTALILCGFSVKPCPHTTSIIEIQVANELKGGRHQVCVTENADGVFLFLFFFWFCKSRFLRSSLTSAYVGVWKDNPFPRQWNWKSGGHLVVFWLADSLLVLPSANCLAKSKGGLPSGRMSQTEKIN